MNNLNLKNNFKLALLIIFPVILIINITLAINKGNWEARWHETKWIFSGEIIESQKIGEMFEYLYQRISLLPEPTSCENGAILKYNSAAKQFECLKCEPGSRITWNEDGIQCFKPKGCKLRYRLKTSTDESEWVETDWGTANGGDWVYGPAAFVTGNPATIAVEVAVMCDEGSSLKLGYRFRGNRGPYWNTTIGSHYADRIVDSGTNTRQSAGYTDPFPKSCNIKGGDGGCGIMIYELDESGPVQCDTQVRYNGFVAYKPGGWGPGYAATYGMSASANTNCNGSGCSMEMAIKCVEN